MWRGHDVHDDTVVVREVNVSGVGPVIGPGQRSRGRTGVTVLSSVSTTTTTSPIKVIRIAPTLMACVLRVTIVRRWPDIVGGD